MALTFYGYPPCDTCRKAKKWLEKEEIPFNEYHIVDHPLSKEELKKWKEQEGLEWKQFFNTSGKKYREMDLKSRLPKASEEEILEWLSSDGMLIKRPVVTDGESVTLGFKEPVFEEKWKAY
ncbi:arsenate reductase family protein [Marinococcus halophilus]|uniref:arsenate reductase family protein n=1 Tax=Marinococcus halophilus TaxID=1371 RepID=UPI0009A668BF|nr:arsenate reductase family protein [Marinococcus halophilus]